MLLRTAGIAIVALLVLDHARCAFVSDLIRPRRDAASDMDNAIIEVFNDCKCVYYYQCDANNYVITSGETIFTVRINVPRIPCKGGTFENEFVCCKLNSTETSSDFPLVLKNPNEDVAVTERNNENETEVTKPPKKILCGSQRTNINVRIFNDEDELTPMAGEFPWIVAIFEKTHSDTYKFLSSGSLIHPKIVLTANHYVNRKQPDIFKVVLNGQIVKPSVGKNSSQDRLVSEIIHHPNYNSGTLFNDIALLILEEPYIISHENHINTICLPPVDVQLENMRCLVAGWGKDAKGEGNNVMKKVELPYVDFNRCQDLLRRTRLGAYFSLHRSFVCAGGEAGKDACNGDGGSPLMCELPTEGRYFQLGIVSWGIGCGEANVPGVYTNVPAFLDWIKKELANKGFSL